MKMDEKRYRLFLELLDSLDLACQLMEEYDSFPHRYGGEVLYQAESHTIQLIGRNRHHGNGSLPDHEKDAERLFANDPQADQ